MASVHHPAAREPDLGRIDTATWSPGPSCPHPRAGQRAGVTTSPRAGCTAKLAELGYVTARSSRHLRPALAPTGARVRDDWQVSRPPDELSYSEQVSPRRFASVDREDGCRSATRLAGAQHYPTLQLAAIAADVFEEVAATRSYLPAEACSSCARRWRARAQVRLGRGPRRGRVTSGAQRRSPDRAGDARAGDVAVVESPTFIGMMTAMRAPAPGVIGVRSTRRHGHRALERLLGRHEVKLVGLQARL